MAMRRQLMTMTPGAAEGEPEPYGRGRLEAVDDVLHPEFLDDYAAFAVDPVVAVEASGYLLGDCCFGQEVAGKLLDGEAVKGHVLVVGTNHPVTPEP